MGFFAFIREGVRRSVLLGFSDAVTELGNRQPGEDLGEHLATTLRQSIALETASADGAGTVGASTIAADNDAGRELLGREGRRDELRLFRLALPGPSHHTRSR